MASLGSRRRLLLRVVWLCAAAAVLFGRMHARADEPAPASASAWVIPGGQEALVAEMLGGTGALAGCTYENASIRGDRIDAHFRCAGRAELVRVELEHRDGPECSHVCTEKFVLTVASAAPPGFVEALRGNVAQHEPPFEFRRLDAPSARRGPSPVHDLTPSPEHGDDEDALRTFAIDRGPALVSGTLLALVVIRALVRRRATASRG